MCFQKAFKNFPAICFQKFSSDLLSKLWKQIAGKNLPASFQIFESYLKGYFWAEKTKMADIKAIIVIMRLIKNTLYIFLEKLKYYIYIYLFISNILVLLRVSVLGLDFINYTSLGLFCEKSVREAWLYTVTVGSF